MLLLRHKVEVVQTAEVVVLGGFLVVQQVVVGSELAAALSASEGEWGRHGEKVIVLVVGVVRPAPMMVW